jgi:hypothetical protein
MRLNYTLVNRNISCKICFMVAKPKGKSWEDRARLFLKAEIKRADLTYEELAERLKAHGFSENAPSIANKLARGTFSATFFLAVAVAIGLPSIPLDSV